MRPPLVIDVFAGGGGAGEGIAQALGRSADIAIENNAEAANVHRAFHPETQLLETDATQIAPATVASGRRVGLVWLSPECSPFSRARGARPLEGGGNDPRHALPWTALRWAREARPNLICVENVAGLRQWGPLDREGRAIGAAAGSWWNAWCEGFAHAGYKLSTMNIRACDHGAPTRRERLIIIARRDRREARCPPASHGPGRDIEWECTTRCIDWAKPGVSIFASPGAARTAGARRPLAASTMAKIAEGLGRHVHPGAIAPDARIAWIMRQFGRGWGHPLARPADTIVASGLGKTLLARAHPSADADAGAAIDAFLVAYFSSGGRTRALNGPGPAVDCRDRYQLARALRSDGALGDITLRLLGPSELARIQGLPARFTDALAHTATTTGLPRASQVRIIGNAVPPAMARAVIEANSETLC